jgi:hypothetical protein
MRPTLVIFLLASLVSSAHASCFWGATHVGFGTAAVRLALPHHRHLSLISHSLISLSNAPRSVRAAVRSPRMTQSARGAPSSASATAAGETLAVLLTYELLRQKCVLDSESGPRSAIPQMWNIHALCLPLPLSPSSPKTKNSNKLLSLLLSYFDQVFI